MKNYDIKEIKIDNCKDAIAITAMLLGRDGNVYVGLTATGEVVARINTADDSVENLGRIFPERKNMVPVFDKVHNSLVEGPGGEIYIGQGLNIDWHAAPFDCDLSAYGGGHLFKFDINTGRLEDYGVQVPFNAIHGMTIDIKRRIIYGYTIPDNHFFIHYLDDHRVEDKGKISNYASHNLVCGQNGTVFGGYFGDIGWSGGTVDEARNKFKFYGTYLYKFHPENDKFIRTKELLVYGDEYDIFSNKGIDSWLCASDGTIYGGTAIGGTIFKVDEKSCKVTVLGKPVLGPRVSGMKEGKDGLIYITAGFPNMHLVVFNPKTAEFTDLGSVNTQRELCYFHGIVVLDDGTIYVGETDSHLPVVYKLTAK
jgi:outer membrane protein assembly factor BamB